MGKASRKKKVGTKFYYVNPTNGALQTVYANSAEEAEKTVAEMFGEIHAHVGTLPHAQSKEETRKLEKLSEDFMGELMGPTAKYIMKTMHEIDRTFR